MNPSSFHRNAPAATAFALALALACSAPAPPAGAAARVRPGGGPVDDPMPGLLRRIERYLRRHEVDGVTMDWRYEVSPSEEIRQTVVCQVLAYAELERAKPSRRLRREIVTHADFMRGRLADIRSHSPFDGMLAYALWSAWETTGEARFRDAALEVSAELRAIPTEACVLNGGLMVAMATAAEWHLTGNEEARTKTHDIVAGLLPYQNADGSFPHWCAGTRDVHYTGWMAMELIHVARLVDDPHVAPLLARMSAFLEARVGPDGRAVYEEPCPGGPPGCTVRYWSRGSGCSIDYDTRAWTVEPAYCALLFDHVGSPEYGAVASFLDELEDGGTLSDMYAHWPPPEDPEYPWTIADTSVVNMSVVFWALATQARGRALRGLAVPAYLDEDAGSLAGDPPAPGPRRGEDAVAGGEPTLAVGPNPSRGSCRLAFVLPRAGAAALEVRDARGRLVRRVAGGVLEAGAHDATWDGRDEAGRSAPAGLYFARLATPGSSAVRRFALVR